MLTPPTRLLSHKLRALKSLQAPRRRHNYKQLAAVQSSEVLVNRAPASTVQQQVRFCTFAVFCLLHAVFTHCTRHVTAWTMQSLIESQGEDCSCYGELTFGHC